MLGAIVGDVLGSIHEHNPIKTKNFELLNANCVFTDDTVMTVAVADSLMNGTSYVESLQMWGSSYPSAGYGCWFNEWIYSDSPEPYNSFGNGSAMRSSSVGWLFDDDTSVLKEAEKSAVITHNHGGRHLHHPNIFSCFKLSHNFSAVIFPRPHKNLFFFIFIFLARFDFLFK